MSNDEWLAWMQKQQTLPVQHWMCRPDSEWYTAGKEPLAVGLARLVGSWTVSLNPGDSQYHRLALRIANQATVPLAVQYSPWHGEYQPAGNPPDPRVGWISHLTQLAAFGTALERLVTLASQERILIGLVCLDCESLVSSIADNGPKGLSRDDQQRWDNCLGEKYNAIDRIARELCPAANICWYGSPSKTRGLGYLGPLQDFCVPSWYTPEDRYDETKDFWTFRGWGLLDYPQRRVRPVLPFVQLGDLDEDYDPEIDRERGYWLATAPNLAGVYFWPEICPWDEGRNPKSLPHLKAYYEGFMAGKGAMAPAELPTRAV